MKLGILILQYGSVEFTNDLCKTIPEAIVIDNGSPKGKEYQGTNRCIRFEENKHFTGGWNAAVKTLWKEFDVFWLCNNDIKLTRADIDRVKEVMGTQKDVGILTPSYNCWLDYARNKKSGGLRDVPMIEFTAPVIRKEVYKLLGFWDERFKRGYGVEFDWCKRLRDHNEKEGSKKWRICVDDLSSFHHIGQQTCNQMPGYFTEAVKEQTEGINALYGKDWKNTIFTDVPLDFNYNYKHGTGGNRILVYTTIFGDYDTLKPVPKQSLNRVIDYICVTDNPKLKVVSPWKLHVVTQPNVGMHPRMRAKYYKLCYFKDELLNQYYKHVFIDASIKVKSPLFVQSAMDDLHGLKLYKHPFRTSIQEEVKISRQLIKYAGEPMEEQVLNYMSYGYPDMRMFACGVMSRINNEKVKELMQVWWKENIKWTAQDQLSFPYVCWKLGFEPDVFNGNQGKNDYFDIIWHDDKKSPAGKIAVNNLSAAKKIPTPVKVAPNIKINPYTYSVLMPVYNTPVAWLTEAFNSLWRQSDMGYELVVVDDGSTDPHTITYLDKMVAEHPMVFHRFEENQKLARALNKGLELCSGDVVIRMDSDDIAYRRLVESHKHYFARFPNTVCVGVQIRGFHKKNYITRHQETVTKQYAYRKTKYWIMNHPGVAYKRDIIMQLGGYGDTLLPAEDYWLWCEILKAGHVMKNMMKVLVDHRVTHPSPDGEEYMRFLQSCKEGLKM